MWGLRYNSKIVYPLESAGSNLDIRCMVKPGMGDRVSTDQYCQINPQQPEYVQKNKINATHLKFVINHE